MENKIEHHPFTPYLPEGCKVVICGTFPPKPEKWAMDFFYPNFYNDMWRVFGLIFYNDKDRFFDLTTRSVDKEGITRLLTQYRIGIGETAVEVIRTKDNASDKYLEIVKPVNLPLLFSKIPDCKALVTTGEKAASIISSLTATQLPKMGEKIECEVIMADGEKRKFDHWRMPSTSRAYPMSLQNKTNYYKTLFKELDIFPKQNRR